jgi:hypothetical protein
MEARSGLSDFSQRFITVVAGLCVVGVIAPSCSGSKSASTASSKAALWGDMRSVVSVKELMRDMIDPASDYIFNSVSVVISKQGTVETLPKTDEDWERLRIGAVTLAEGVLLLNLPRPVVPPGEENVRADPDATELSPTQITAKLQADPVEWNARIQALRNVGLEVLDIVKRKDAKELWDASENLDAACENCHRSYWYPGEDAEFYRALNGRIRQLSAPHAQ